MKTRRSRKAESATAGAASTATNAASAEATPTNNANDTNVDVDMSNSSQQPGAFVLPMPEDLDLSPLETLFPDANLAAPTPETVVAFYHVLLAQLEDNESVQRALDEARAEVERKEVEVDQAIQDREVLSRELETSIERLQKDLTNVKQEKEALGNFSFSILPFVS
jgi:nucleoprotein TPR